MIIWGERRIVLIIYKAGEKLDPREQLEWSNCSLSGHLVYADAIHRISVLIKEVLL